jgi:endonuclease/exonuclease/phosphatase family metal-dependent hydrolase
VVIANIIAAACLLLSYLSTHISPLTLPYLAFFGIAYGLLLVANVGFVVFWILVKKRLALISGITLLVGFNHLTAYFQLIPARAKEVGTEKSIHIVSYNVRLFGWYNWKTNKKDRDTMINALAAQAPDVVCFQEYFHHSKPGVFDVTSLVKKKLKTPYIHIEDGLSIKNEQNFGMAIASKYPIIGKGKIKFPMERGNACIYVDLLIGGDTVRVYNAHVASIRFSHANYKFVEDLQSNLTPNQPSEGLNIVQRMSRAWQRRAKHVNMIVNHIDSSPYPVILCGDLNDTPVSHTYRQFNRRLDDAFRHGGWGIGNTYLGSFPSFRIDYIFYDPRFTAANYTTFDEEISDHRAVSCRVYLD